MNAYYIRNGHIAIIETDTPAEPGWIKLKSTQSRLAARYRLDDAGKVVDAYPGQDGREEVLAAIAEQQAVQAQSTELPPRVSIQAAPQPIHQRGTTPCTRRPRPTCLRCLTLKLKQEVNLDDLQTVGGHLQSLAAAGLFVRGPAQEVLK